MLKSSLEASNVNLQATLRPLENMRKTTAKTQPYSCIKIPGYPNVTKGSQVT